MRFIKEALLALLLCAPLAVTGAVEPAREPIHIVADRAELNDATGISTYTGNVVLTQGATRIKADHVVVRSEDNEVSLITARGNPIRYFQEEEGQAPIQGQSLRMEYDAQTEVLLLLDQAEFQRGTDHFSGSRIRYDRIKEKVTASVADNGDQRVHITIQPKSSQGKKDQTPETGAPGAGQPKGTP
jgi:lipopolysaccharide export system protein LptA